MIHSIMSDLLNTGQQGTLHLTSEFTRSLKVRRVIRGICERRARAGAGVAPLSLAGSFEITRTAALLMSQLPRLLLFRINFGSQARV